MPEPAWTDKTRMPWGKYKGVELGKIKAQYLLWLYEQPWIKSWPGLYQYLKVHEDLLMAEKQTDSADLDPDDFRTYDDYKRHL